MRKKKKSKNPEGRPPFYKTPEELQKKIDKYFKTDALVSLGIVEEGKKEKTIKRYCPTITGLVIYLGFSSRDTFYEYEKKPEFTDTIKKARTRVENAYERLLHSPNCTGAIFALKNFGWIDRQEFARPKEENQTQEVISEQLARITAILAKRKVG
jgi:hypothetical protein